jgi:hypothetical protein
VPSAAVHLTSHALRWARPMVPPFSRRVTPRILHRDAAV